MSDEETIDEKLEDFDPELGYHHYKKLKDLWNGTTRGGSKALRYLRKNGYVKASSRRARGKNVHASRTDKGEKALDLLEQKYGDGND